MSLYICLFIIYIFNQFYLFVMIVSEYLGLKFFSFGFIIFKYSNKCVYYRVLGYGLEVYVLL